MTVCFAPLDSLTTRTRPPGTVDPVLPLNSYLALPSVQTDLEKLLLQVADSR